MLSSAVNKILIKDNLVKGVVTNKGKELFSDIVVSNIDSKQTFIKLINREEIDTNYLRKIESTKESVSFYLLYLGLDKDVDLKALKRGFYHTSENLEFSDNNWFYISVPTKEDQSLAPDGKQIISAVVSVNKSYEEVEDWNIFKEKMKKYTLNYLESLVPDIQEHINVIDTATPKTLNRYTLNSKGAAYGGAVNVDQTWSNRLQHTTPFKNLFLTGHWTNPGPGVCAVVSSGWRVANLILNN
jgi:phytoene dehydrogenase-like protein